MDIDAFSYDMQTKLIKKTNSIYEIKRKYHNSNDFKDALKT